MLKKTDLRIKDLNLHPRNPQAVFLGANLYTDRLQELYPRSLYSTIETLTIGKINKIR